MPLLNGFGKRQQGVVYENQRKSGFFCFELSFQNNFLKLFSTSGLSQICKIRNAWKLLRPFSKNSLIPRSEMIGI
jgi:hypothetical protein